MDRCGETKMKVNGVDFAEFFEEPISSTFRPKRKLSRSTMNLYIVLMFTFLASISGFVPIFSQITQATAQKAVQVRNQARCHVASRSSVSPSRKSLPASLACRNV